MRKYTQVRANSTAEAEQRQPKIRDKVVREEIHIDQHRQRRRGGQWRMGAEAKVEQAPDAGQVAADRRVHETGEQRHAADAQHAGLGVDPGPRRRLEQFHAGTHHMEHQDDLGLVPGFHAQGQERSLDAQRGQRQEIVAGKPGVLRIPPVRGQQQGAHQAAEQAGPRLLHTETEELIKGQAKTGAAGQVSGQPRFPIRQSRDERPVGGRRMTHGRVQPSTTA